MAVEVILMLVSQEARSESDETTQHLPSAASSSASSESSTSATISKPPSSPSAVRFYSKSTQFKEFSNFFGAPFHIDGFSWPTVEHYFQAMKFPSDPAYQEKMRTSASPASTREVLFVYA